MFPSSNMCPLIPPAPLTSDYSATVQKSVISNSYDNFAIQKMLKSRKKVLTGVNVFPIMHSFNRGVEQLGSSSGS